MIKPEKPKDEAARLAALHRYDILDSGQESAYDDLVAIALSICGVDGGMVSLIDAERQWFKARHGMERPDTPRDESFCAHAILHACEVMVVPDATLDPRFADNPLVTAEGGIRFYAGAPLLSGDGHPIGTLCVFDTRPRRIDEAQVSALRALSRQVTHLLELRRVSRELSTQLRERDWYERQLQLYHEELETQNANLSEQTRTDPLTGLANRRAFAAALDTAMHRAQGTGQGLAIGVLDIDHFKMINDLHGHAEGDQVLVALADMLKAQFAGRGMAARYGGEEFVMLFTDCTLDLARLQCELIRQSVTLLPVGLPFTVSIGVADTRPGDTSEQMFKRADAALYAAKRGGRDQVAVAQ